MTLSGQGRGGEHRLRGQCLGHADDLGHALNRRPKNPTQCLHGIGWGTGFDSINGRGGRGSSSFGSNCCMGPLLDHCRLSSRSPATAVECYQGSRPLRPVRCSLTRNERLLTTGEQGHEPRVASKQPFSLSASIYLSVAFSC
jgi:hypothetical protein